MSRTALLALVVVGLLVSPGLASAAEDPRFETFVPEPTLAPGGGMQVVVQLVNDASAVDERARTARNVRVTPTAGDAPVEVLSGTRTIGAMGDEAVREVPIRVRVPRNASAGTYQLRLRVRYEYGDDETGSQTVSAAVRIDRRPRFAVVSTESDVAVGDSGTVSFALRNVGEETARASTVSVQSRSPDVAFGQTASASRFVGAWEPGETRTVTYDARVSPDAEQRSYALQATVSYEDTDGNAGQSAPLSAGVTPGPAQSFALSEVSDDLRVGEEGSVTTTVTNDGPEPVRDAVVVLSGTGRNVHPLETEYAVGDLDAGESTTVELPIEVSEAAGDGPRQLSFVVQYQNGNGDQRASDPLNARVTVAEQRPQFVVEPGDASVTAGSSATVTLVVTNNGDEAVRNVDAKAFVDDPLGTSDDEAFVRELGPGESTEVTFGLDAAPGALAKAYSVSVDFQYEEADGDTRLSRTFQSPVEVTEPQRRSGVPVQAVVAGVLLVAAVALGGWFWVRR